MDLYTGTSTSCIFQKTANLAEDTNSIFETVDSYIKSIDHGHAKNRPVYGKVEIEYGVGMARNLVMSASESKWPEYLEYS
jgi:hypothetical protein